MGSNQEIVPNRVKKVIDQMSCISNGRQYTFKMASNE